MTTRSKGKKTAAASPSPPPPTQSSSRLPVGYGGQPRVPPMTNTDRDQLREEFYAAYNSLLAQKDYVLAAEDAQVKAALKDMEFELVS